MAWQCRTRTPAKPTRNRLSVSPRQRPRCSLPLPRRLLRLAHRAVCAVLHKQEAVQRLEVAHARHRAPPQRLERALLLPPARRAVLVAQPPPRHLCTRAAHSERGAARRPPADEPPRTAVLRLSGISGVISSRVISHPLELELGGRRPPPPRPVGQREDPLKDGSPAHVKRRRSQLEQRHPLEDGSRARQVEVRGHDEHPPPLCEVGGPSAGPRRYLGTISAHLPAHASPLGDLSG